MQVTGDSIFNLLQLGDVETDKNDRPLNPPPKIISVEVGFLYMMFLLIYFSLNINNKFKYCWCLIYLKIFFEFVMAHFPSTLFENIAMSCTMLIFGRVLICN